GALDLPTVPTTANAPNLQGGTHVSELVTLEPDERVLCLTTLAEDSLGLAVQIGEAPVGVEGEDAFANAVEQIQRLGGVEQPGEPLY
ncbi:MAG: hypothetical protein ACJ8BF_13795, partial [Gemmatimonadales bacterium]